MSWKKFLKPDWRKIVIFIVLIIVLMILPFRTLVSFITEYGWASNFSFCVLFCLNIIQITGRSVYWNCPLTFLFLVLFVILSYLVSCLIMRYKKFLMPDIRKVIMFIILILFSPIIIVITSSYTSPPLWRFGALFFELLNYFIRGYSSNIRPLFFDITITILIVAFLYVPSCFIVWIYDKVKKK